MHPLSRSPSHACQFLTCLALATLVSLAPTPASASHGPLGTPVVTSVDLQAFDLAFDPGTDKIYASIRASAGLLGNHVVAIDPDTGAVGPSVFVGSDPGALAISDDGQYLYVALRGAAAVRRVQLATMTAGLQFPLGFDPNFGPLFVEDLDVSPGDPGVVAVSRFRQQISPRHGGVAVYDDGVKLPDETPAVTQSNVIEFGSSGARLYGFNNETTEYGFRRMNVTGTGVSILDTTPSLISGFDTDIEFDGGLIYATTGRAIDAEARTLVGTYPIPAPGPVEPDADHERVYFVSSGALRVFEQSTFVLEDTVPISGTAGARSLIETGDGDLAFRTNDRVFFVRFQTDADTTPPTITVPPDMTVEATGLDGAVVTYAASATDDVDGPVPVTCEPPSGDTFPVGVSTVVCSAIDAAGNGSAKSFRVTVTRPWFVTAVHLPTNDLVYDSVTEMLYASMPSDAGPGLGNRVAAIDPVTGEVEASVFVGSEPGKLALSGDGQFLYVGLDGAAAVRRVALATLTAGLQFSLGSGSNGPHFAEDIAVRPGDPGTVAVARRNVGFSPRHEGVAIYDDGVQLSNVTPGHTGSNVIEFGAATRLYGQNNETTEYGFRRMNVGATGVSVADVRQRLLVSSGFDWDIEFDDGRIYATTGRVIDPEALVMLAWFTLPGAGPIEPDSANESVYALAGGTLSVFDSETFTPVESVPIPGIAGTPSSLVATGGRNLAFRTSADQLFLVREEPPPPEMPPVADFDGDGDTDVSVWRPSSGTWYVFGGATEQWGVSSDVPAPADYDGDGDVDIAVWRPSTGTWFVQGGATQQWGISTDVPVPGEYFAPLPTGVEILRNADFAVWRPSTGTWYVHGGQTQQWGISSDVPVPGDYDGDSFTDFAVWRPSTGTWFIHGGPTVEWGVSSDVPVPGDYDGDGDTDIAVWRPSDGTWYVHGGPTVQWGVSPDVPVPGDYDGDGDTEIAVWRPSDGTWYVHVGGVLQWGIASDKPLPPLPSVTLRHYPGPGDLPSPPARPRR